MELQNRIIGVAGRKGSGKSTKARELLERCDRLFVYDTMGEHVWIPERHSNLSEAVIAIMETPNRDRFWISIIPEGDDPQEEFEEICATVYDQGNLMFGVEEVPMLGCSPQFTPKKFNKLVRLGRHRQISLLYTAQRLGECPRALTSATDVFVLFCHTEPRDLDAISERTEPAIAQKVSMLGDHGFLVWDVKERRELSTDDPEWYSSVVSAYKPGEPTNAG